MTKAELIAENEKLKARIAELEAALKKALAQPEAKGQAGKRQAAPFSKEKKKEKPKRPGRKKGHQPARRAKPERVHREVNAPLKQSSCLYCGGRLSSPRIERQYQIDIPPVEPVVTQFNRAIRPAAIVRKTSGGNRSQAGAKTHAIITSLWQRCRQQGRNFLAVVTELLRQPVPQPIFLVPPAPTGVSSKAPPAPLT